MRGIKSILLSFVVGVCFAIVSAFPLFAGEIQGVVKLIDGNPPVYSAKVTASGPGDKSAQTNPDGSFALTDLSDGTWSVYAEAPLKGFSANGNSDPVQVTITGSNTVVLPDPLRLKHNVTGYIKLSDGSPAYAATAYLYDQNDDYIESSAESDGSFRFALETGDYELQIEPASSDNCSLAIVGIPFSVDNPSVMLTIVPSQFEEAPKKINGSVTLKGTGAPNVEINITSWDDFDNWRYPITDGNGGYSVCIPGGEWEVEVTSESHVAWVSPDIQEVIFEQNDTLETKTLPIQLLPAEGYIAGRILDPLGNPLPESSSDKLNGVSVDITSCETGVWQYIWPKGKNIAPIQVGDFSFPLISGIYDVEIWVDEEEYPDYAGKVFSEVQVTGTSVTPHIVNLGDIRLLARNSIIEGYVKDAAGTGLSGVWIDAVQPDGNWYYAETDSTGYYQIKVCAGAWIVEPWLWASDFPDDVFTEFSKEVGVGDNKTVTVNFQSEKVAGTILGEVRDPNGNLITSDLGSWAYARKDSSPRPIVETYVGGDGKFELKVPEGNFNVGLDLPPESGYAFFEEKPVVITVNKMIESSSATTGEAASIEMRPYEKQVVISSGKTRSSTAVTITLRPNDAVIRGTIKDANGSPVTGISGKIVATPAWNTNYVHTGAVNSSDGTYSMTVAAGEWNLTYQLETSDYISSPIKPIRTTAASGQEQVVDLPLIALDGVVMGYVQDDQGKKMPGIQVWLRAARSSDPTVVYENMTVTNETGKFIFKAPLIFDDARVGVALKDFSDYSIVPKSRAWSYYPYKSSSPQPTSIRPPYRLVRSEENTILVLRKADTLLKGKVTLNGQGVEKAYVYAFSNDGQKADAETQSDGSFQLPVARATVEGSNLWTIRSAYRGVGSRNYYRSQEVRADISGIASEIVLPEDLSLSSAGEIPASEIFEYTIKDGWSGVLSDGARIQIPGGAFTLTGKNNNQVDELKILVDPIVMGLPDTKEDLVAGYGYDIGLYEKDSGKKVSPKFEKKASITFRYTDALLTELGVSEADLRPAYLLEANGTWQPIEAFTLDTAANKVTFQTDHFSKWALTVRKDAAIKGDIDLSGKVDLTDAILCLQIIAGVNPAKPISRTVTVKTDSAIGQTEAVFILQSVVALR